jgi:hypothetical protein
VPVKVTPDAEGGWTYEGVGSFEQEGLQRAMKAVKGQIAPDRPTSTKLVPPGRAARLVQQPIEVLIAA